MSTAKCEIVPTFPSPKVCAVYTINHRAYTVYSTGVYSGRDEIVSFNTKIVDSTLCGQALALFLSDSTLAVLSARTLSDEQYWGSDAEIVEEPTGVSHFYEMLPKGTQMISADYSGSLICVHLGFSRVAIFEYSAATHSLNGLKSTIIEHEFTKFQVVSVGSMPYLWTVGYDEDQHHCVLELHEIASLAFKHTAGRELCHLPLNIPLSSVAKPKIEMLPADEREGGLFIYAAQIFFYIPLSSAIAGDTHPTLYPAFDAVTAVFYTQRYSEGRTFYIADLRGFVFQLFLETNQKRVGRSVQEVSEIPKYASSHQEKWFYALPSDSEVICVPRDGTRITQCELDTRKWPWRILVLSGSHLTALAPVTAVEYTEKAALNNLNSVLMITQVPRLKTLFISTTSGTGWLAPNEIAFDGLKDRSLLAAGIMSNSLVFVFATRVELRSIFAPFILMNSWDAGANDLILDATIGTDCCLLHMLERVVAIKANGTSLVSSELLSGLTVSFVRCDEGKSYIGVALISEADQYALRHKLSNYTITENPLFQPSSIAGATLCIDHTLSRPIEIRFHGYLPTDLITLRGGTSVVLYGVDGRVMLVPAKGGAPTLYNVLSTVRIAGRLGRSKQVVILYGRGGLWEVTEKGCRMIYDRRSRKLGDVIEQACTLEDGNIAVIKKGELRFLQSPRSYGNQLPAQLQTVSNLAKNTRMLLIPSKRIILVHGGSVCTFMDSVSFELLTVSGLRAQCCDQATLWQFELNDESYEHLVFSNGKGAIESYAVHRDRENVNLECKFRFLVCLDTDTNLRTREVLHCQGRYVYLGRHDYLLKASPMDKRRFGPIYFGNQIRYVSQVDNFLIVSTETSINIVDATEFHTCASIVTGKSNAGHVAGYVDIKGHKLLHILCAREKERFLVLVFDARDRTLKLNIPRLDGLSEREHRIRSLSQVPTRLTDNGFSVVAVMEDYSIKHIAVTSPSNTFGMAVVEMVV